MESRAGFMRSTRAMGFEGTLGLGKGGVGNGRAGESGGGVCTGTLVIAFAKPERRSNG